MSCNPVVMDGELLACGQLDRVAGEGDVAGGEVGAVVGLDAGGVPSDGGPPGLDNIMRPPGLASVSLQAAMGGSAELRGVEMDDRTRRRRQSGSAHAGTGGIALCD